MLTEGGSGTADHSDTVDLIFQAVQKVEEREDDEGKIQYIQVMDDLSLWCKTLQVASNKLSQVIYEMMEIMRVGLEAERHMSLERAKIFRRSILSYVNSIRKTLDSKSSESVVNGENKQNTLLGMVNKNSVEKIYTMKDNGKTGMFDRIIGRKVEDDND